MRGSATIWLGEKKAGQVADWGRGSPEKQLNGLMLSAPKCMVTGVCFGKELITEKIQAKSVHAIKRKVQVLDRKSVV